MPNWMALSLTDSRTAQVSAAAGIGTAAGILILQSVKKNKEKKGPARTAAVCGALLTATVCIGLLMGTVFAFNALKTAKGRLLPVAGAEAGQTEIRVIAWFDKEKVGIGEKTTLNAKAEGAEGEVSYQWQYCVSDKWINLKGDSTNQETCKITVKSSTYNRTSRCVVTAANGMAVSGGITILKPYDVTLAVRSAKDAGP